MANAHALIVAPEVLVGVVQIGTRWSENRPSDLRLF
jgi:hypothetical protein